MQKYGHRNASFSSNWFGQSHLAKAMIYLQDEYLHDIQTNYEQRYFLTAPNASTVLKETKILPIYILLYVSDLNRIRRETIKKRLVWLMGEFMREHEAVNSGCVKVRSLQYLQKWQMIVLIFLYRVL